jgi:UDP:flavonoid glycosyltransferase YjiC (YdhE family)
MDTLLNNKSYTEAALRMSEVIKATGGVNKAADIVETRLAQSTSKSEADTNPSC